MTDIQNHTFEQVIFASDRLFRKKPEPIHTSDVSTAVIVHLFYPNIWQEIDKGYIIQEISAAAILAYVKNTNDK